MNTSLLAAGLSALLLAPVFAGSALLTFHPSQAPLTSAEHEPWYLEGDLGRDRPGQALVLTVSDTTQSRVLDAYRQSTPTDTPSHLGLTPVHYGKVFGRAAATDTYYLLARLTTRDGTPFDDRPRLWRRTGPTPWRYLGADPDPDRIPRPLRDAWTIREPPCSSPVAEPLHTRGPGAAPGPSGPNSPGTT
ncbi:hypothetical protein [Actinocorallia libanotica]|uniref:Secreted protein n=1 Tax=Actinocorallia libanotica TaxID=46162 RepID=A0ABN1RSZ5_9ACTN